MPQEQPAPQPQSNKWAKAESKRPPRTTFQEIRRGLGKAAGAAGGFVENTLDDAFDILKGLFVVLPTTIGRSAFQIWQDRKYLGQAFDEGEVTKSLRDIPGQMKDAIIAPYKEHGFSVIYKKPITTLLDALTIVDLGAHSVLKFAPKGSRVARAAEALRTMPQRVLREGIDKAVLKMTGWNNEQARIVGRSQRNTFGMMPEQVAANHAALPVFKKLSSEERALFEDYRAIGLSAEDAAKFPNVHKAINEWRGLAKGEADYLKRRRLLNDAGERAVLEKKFINKMQEKGIPGWEKYDRETRLKARKIIEALPEDRRPIYTPAIFESEGQTLEKILSQPGMLKTAKTAMLEAYTGAAGAIKDPAVYIPRAIQNFHKLKATIEFYDQIFHNPALAKSAKAGEVSISERLPSHGIQQKYYEDRARARGLKVAELKRQYGDAYESMIVADPAIQKEIAEAVNVIVAPTVQKLLQLREARLGGGVAATVRLYDKIISAFKVTATKFNPRWYTGQAFGDALLGQLAGADWAKAIEYLKSKGKLPPEVLGAGGMHGIAEGGWLSDLAQAPDILARTGIIAKEVARRMSAAGYSLEQIERMMPQVLEATRDFYKVNSELVVVREQIARKSTAILGMDKDLAKLIERERKLAAKVEELVGNPSLIKTEHEALGAQKALAEQADVVKGQASLARYGEKLSAAEIKNIIKDVVAKRTEQKRVWILSDEGVKKVAALNERRKALLEASLKDAVDRSELLKVLDEEIRRLSGLSKYAQKKLAKEIPRQITNIAKQGGGYNEARILRDFESGTQTAYRGELIVATKKALAERGITIADDALEGIIEATTKLEELKGAAKQAKELKSIAETSSNAKIASGNEAIDRAVDAAIENDIRKVFGRLGVKATSEQLKNVIESVKVRGEYAQQLKSIKGQQRAVEAGLVEKTESVAGRLKEAEQALESLRQEIVQLGTKREMTLSDLMNDFLNEKGLSARMPELQRMMDFLNPAMERANAFIGDYLGLNGFEQGVLKRLVPFYPWTKAMTQLAFRLPFIAPAKTFLWHRYAMAMATLIGDENLPEWVRGYIPVFARSNGDLVWVRMSTFSPTSGVKTTHLGGIPIPNVMAIHEQNPIISLGYQLAGGKTIFQRSTIPYGEQMVNISNGDVYQFQENGMLKKIIPQTPLIAGVAHMFPITQWLESVLTPYVVSKYDWMGFPEPMLKPNGQVRYPRELYQNLASAFGFSTMQRSKKDLIRGEQRKVRQVIQSYRKAYRKASPDEREYIKQALRDYAKQMKYRHIEGD